MIWLILGALLFSQEPASASPEVSRPLALVQDPRALSRCMDSLVGFRNVPVQCVVGADGYLGQCELTTDNRDVLRVRSRFICMAESNRVTYPDGSPATGRTVAFRIHGTSDLSSSADNRPH